MILITGSTGHFGTATIGSMLSKGVPAREIAALARNKDKAQPLHELGVDIRWGNYDDFPSLMKAFQGIDTLLFISGNDVGKRDLQHDNVIKAAVATSVKHIIYTSFERKNDDLNSPMSFISKTHIETERKILETGVNYTFLRNALYAEGIPMFIGEDVIEKGIYFPAGEGKVPFASRIDMAEGAADILVGSGHENKSYSFVNIKNYSFYEIASILSEITGREIKYFCPSAEEFRNTLSKGGVPDKTIDGIVGWAEGIKQGYFESEYSDLEKIIGRKPLDLKSILLPVYSGKRVQVE
jgi:NAD(P)H dehydrogenase (quinone)